MFTMIPYRRHLSRPNRAFDRMLTEPFFQNFFNAGSTSFANSFRVDIREMSDSYQILAELPGLTQDNIKLTLDEDLLTISANFEQETQENQGGRLYSERRSGQMERSFNLNNIAIDKITAAYKNGILTVNLPKEEPEEKLARKIDIAFDEEQTEKSE